MSQNALLLQEAGKPLVIGTRAVPQPGENQLLVKVLVAGRKSEKSPTQTMTKQRSVNPHDRRTRDDGLFVTSFTYVLASDLVGEVVTVGTGEHSSKSNVGEHVFGHTFSPGGFDNDFNGVQQYALVDARFVGRLADSGVSDDEAATIPVNVVGKVLDYSKVTLLVIGGGSNTGRATIELAKLAGIGQIIAVAGHHSEEKLKAIGATHVINRHSPDILVQVRAITGDELVYAVDTVNAGVEQELGVAALSNKKKSTLITLRHPDGDFDAASIGPKTEGYQRRLVFGVSPMYPEVTVGFWEEIPRWLKERKVRPSSFEIISGLDADAVNGALDHYRDGKGVKTNIHPWR